MAIIPYSHLTRIEHADTPAGIRTWGRMVSTRGSADVGAPIRCLVGEWPFSEDENGIPYDQANLYAVSTRLRNVYDPDAGGPFVGGYVGNDQWITAVPRQLPAGYTWKGRCGHVIPLIQDFLGDYPWLGVGTGDPGSFIRTPVYWRDTTGVVPSGGYLWTPMNLNNQGDFIAFTGTAGISSTVALGMMTGPKNHIGMRGIRGPDISAQDGYTYEIIVCGVTPGDPAPDLVDPPAGEVWRSASYSAAEGETITIEENGAIHGDNGTLLDYYFILRVTCAEGDGPPAIGGGGNLYWGPRTDVPLWFTATTLNLVAPGGVIIPP